METKRVLKKMCALKIITHWAAGNNLIDINNKISTKKSFYRKIKSL